MMINTKDICDILHIRSAAGLSFSPADSQALANSIYHHSFKLLRDPLERVVGYVTWANVDNYTAQRLVNTCRKPMYLYEWQEGKTALFLDVVFQPGSSHEALPLFIDLVNQYDSVAFIRRSRARWYKKVDEKFKRMRDTIEVPAHAMI